LKAEDIRSHIRNVRFKKCQVIIYTGNKEKFVDLVKKLPDSQIVYVRDALIEECDKRNINELNKTNISSVASSIIPNLEGKITVFIDTELFVKYDIIKTQLMGHDYYSRIYLVHIPERYLRYFHGLDAIEVR